MFYPLKKSVNLIGYVSHRLYMRLNLELLYRFGLRLNGCPRYIASNVYFDDMDRIELGDRVVISSNVRFLTHDYTLTTALHAVGSGPETDVASVRPIVVGRNVFIGMCSIVMPGTKIGDDVIIGAGAVVRGVVPSRSVLIGNPAEVVMSIDDAAERALSRVGLGEVRVD
jgi:acetyltransferase-like isoleucine patch superfamily enzyme